MQVADPLVRRWIHGMNEAFTMEVTMPVRTEQGHQDQRRDPRRSVRQAVMLRVMVADKAGLANGQVIDLTTRGCGLRLTKPLRRGQYLTLKLYANDWTPSVFCALARVRWVEADRAGVAFLSLSPEHEHRLHQLYGHRLVFEFED